MPTRAGMHHVPDVVNTGSGFNRRRPGTALRASMAALAISSRAPFLNAGHLLSLKCTAIVAAQGNPAVSKSAKSHIESRIP